ncbi:NADPH:quinone reductase-like Zn-dependent oxidoreductase [Streptomyces sp. LBL]|uniref:zinc-dependent alcohol dehydrogenase family protein n=1 Tax=Streptomyces sp. LBL TaxID=2940562 RepID=UPI002476579A|nr:zinc-dependent alcohol dehydrogenase family protein [Streptomyces sp. LBL]MDH6622906.1 NADPH:quinone reductase-like Zn-dependent oxidoreductase [Streptomyces sp. LBL]
MRAIQITQFGKPEDVVRVVDLQEPNAPGAGEVKVAVEFSPLNLHDLKVVRGELGRPPLPLVLGSEGVGRVVEAGPGVDTLAAGDLVVLPLLAGAWRERLLLPADGLFRLPEGSVEQLSMLGINPPTAGLILSEYADLRPGDWIVQNAANSGVGRSLIALAKARGFRTINFVRDESVFAELTAAGADIVRLDGATAVEEVRTAIGDARVGLAVDSVGGDAPARLLDLLSEGGALVSYASATGQPMSVDALTLIGKRATVHGFFAGHFDYATKVLPVIREAAPLVASGALFVPLGAVFDLDDIHTAIEQVVRGGKTLLKVARS